MSSTVNNTSSSNNLGINSDPTKTSRGTKIVQSDGSMDKNAFLRILTAELSNQDPDNAKDSTQYVAQMAQFTSLEQMSNLNTNIQMSSANSMIGKLAFLKTIDSSGNQISGILRDVQKQGSNVKLGIEVTKNGAKEIDEFNFDDLTGVANNPDDVTNVNNDAMNILAEASMIGKKAEFDLKDASGNNYKGIINGVTKTNGTFNLNVTIDGTNEKKDFDMANLISLFNAQ
jgi:flagellar basal-body rod modification protein FlgD